MPDTHADSPAISAPAEHTQEQTELREAEGERTKGGTRKAPFADREKARQAGLASGLARQRKKEERERNGPTKPPDGPFGVFVPVDLESITAGLGAAAQRGNAQAARELRAWLSEYPTTRDDSALLAKQPEDMTPAELERARATLLRYIAREEKRQSEGYAGAYAGFLPAKQDIR